MSKIATARQSVPMTWSVALVALALALFQALPARGDVISGQLAYQQGRYDEALANWRPAAERGDAEAEFDLGIMYYKGVGVSADPVEAYAWFARAAGNGNELAGRMLTALSAELSRDQLAQARRLIERK